MGCIVADKCVTLDGGGNLRPLVRATVYAVPSAVPLFLNGQLLEYPGPSTQTDANGAWQLYLPWQSESTPNTVYWTIYLPDGAAYAGNSPQGYTGPLNLTQLISVGWGLVAGPASSPVTTVVGPRGGFNWRGAYGNSTAYLPGDTVSYTGSSYICTVGVTGVLPTNTSYWSLIAQQGAAGGNVFTTKGDTLYSSDNSGTQTRLPIGSAGQVLTVAGGLPSWATASSGFANPMTTTQDLIVGGASGAANRLPVGSNGQVLTITSGVVGWATATSGFANPMTASGDLISGGTGGAAGRLAIGTAGQVLTVFSGAPTWITPFIAAPSSGAPTIAIGDGSFSGGAAPAFQGTAYLGVNAGAAYTHNLLDLQVAGVSKFSVDYQGIVVTPGAIGTKVKAGAPVDGDYAASTAQNGMMVINSNNNHLYARIGGAWIDFGATVGQLTNGATTLALGSGGGVSTGGSPTTPTLSNVNAGLTASSVNAASSNLRGSIQITNGASSLAANSKLFTINWNGSLPARQFTAFVSVGTPLGYYPNNESASSVDCYNSNPLTASTTYTLNYISLG